MCDGKALREQLRDFEANGLATIGWHRIEHDDVRLERDVIFAELPNVQMVHALNAIDGANGARPFAEIHVGLHAFHQNMDGLRQHGCDLPQHVTGDQQGQRGVNPGPATPQDKTRADEHGNAAKRVGDVVYERRPKHHGHCAPVVS